MYVIRGIDDRKHEVSVVHNGTFIPIQTFQVRANAFSFVSFLNGNARIELVDLGEADLNNTTYQPASLR
jgi:hypothetical protein